MEPSQPLPESSDPSDPRWQGWQAGERIETLLNASSVNGVAARERAEELVRQVTTLYGEGLAQMLRILDAARVLEPPVWDALVADDLVAGLLLIHGLHPHDVRTRVESALESVRPYLGTHGGDVELLGVTDDGTVRLRLLGSCDGCPSSSVTLELAVESAVEAAAPEVTSIEVTSGAKPQVGRPLIPVTALRSRLGGIDTSGSIDAGSAGPASEDAGKVKAGTVGAGSPSGAPSHPASRHTGSSHWAAAPELADLGPGEVGGFSVSGTDLLVCRIGHDLFAFADLCPRCESSMAGARLERLAAAPVGSGVLICPTCRSHYDVRRAGAGVDVDGLHLSPFPLLLGRDGYSVALPTRLEPVVAS